MTQQPQIPIHIRRDRILKQRVSQIKNVSIYFETNLVNVHQYKSRNTVMLNGTVRTSSRAWIQIERPLVSIRLDVYHEQQHKTNTTTHTACLKFVSVSTNQDIAIQFALHYGKRLFVTPWNNLMTVNQPNLD
jgi:hypothetical protein